MVVAVADRLVPMVTGVERVNKRIMRLRFSHTLGVITLLSVDALIRISEFSVKKWFYAMF